MRVGDFSVEVIGTGNGVTRETGSGHVLARPGQVYTLRLRNHGPLRAVADISIDGHSVSGRGLVIDPSSSVDLERPIHATERGRFTVIAEGDERVFGPDGGRDNPNLGLIEARFRRELPNRERYELGAPSIPRPIIMPTSPPAPASPPAWPRRPFAPPEWTSSSLDDGMERLSLPKAGKRNWIQALMAPAITTNEPVAPLSEPPELVPSDVERAAGTGLTGSSSQEFVPVHVGQLESEATVIRLRLVIATEEALDAPRALPDSESERAPARPAARP
jgi:hypothetical protein